MNEWLIAFAKEHNLECEVLPIADGATTANIILRVPATPGYENHPGVILQAHQDMVCEKNADCEHDFLTDPILTYEEDGWLKAKGTTLGADNGIGIALALAAITSPEVKHPAIECLFTTDEETGLTGANCLPADVLRGERLINLDNEDDGQICMGCAGGIDTLARAYYNKESAPKDYFPLHLSVSGLQGGHSGEDINKGRGNANKLLLRFLLPMAQQTDLRLASIDGGNLRNAIARNAEAVVLVPFAFREEARILFNRIAADLEAEMLVAEPDMKLSMESTDMPEFVLPKDLSISLIRALVACPHGMVAMSRDIPGLVQTSTNLASVKMKEDERGTYVEINTSQRSSVESEKHALKDCVEAALALCGAEVTHGDGYPGWKPNPASELLKVTRKAWQEVTGKEAEVVAIHAGLECGLFLEKYPQLDMVAFGPTMRDVHSPAERLCIESTHRTYAWLVKLLEML